jgi:hypothetical protein
MQFVDLPRTLLLQVVALLVKVPQFDVCMPIAFLFFISLHSESPIWQLPEMEHSPKEC